MRGRRQVGDGLAGREEGEATCLCGLGGSGGTVFGEGEFAPEGVEFVFVVCPFVYFVVVSAGSLCEMYWRGEQRGESDIPAALAFSFNNLTCICKSAICLCASCNARLSGR